MIIAIKEAFVDKIKSTDLLDYVTRERTLEKVIYEV